MEAFKFLLLGTILSFSLHTKAQVSINVNIGTPPAWGPVDYPDAYYYYLPDIGAYYDVREEVFICHGHRGWYRSRVLPGIYADFDLYNGCKVVLDFRGDHPYRYYETHRVQYPVGYRVPVRYYKGHHHHHHHHHHDNGHHYGEYKHGHNNYTEVIYADDHHGGHREHGHGRRRG